MKVVRSGSSDASADEIAISSEYEVVRNGWFGDRWVEVLDHTKSAVVMDRAQHGLALLREHTPDGLIGRVENIRIDSDKVLRGTIKWSRNDAGQNAKRDFEDGILPDVSVGYRIHEYTLERADKETNTEYYRVTKWEPLEASLVAIPADPTVGKGRAVDDGATPQKNTPPVVKQEVRMSEVKETPTPAAPVAVVEERSKHNPDELAKLARSFEMRDKLPEWVERKVTTIEALAEVQAELKERAKKSPDIDSGGRDPLENVSRKEKQDFSIARAIAAAASGKWDNAGYEREIQQEFAKQGHTARNDVSFLVPTRHGFSGMQTRATGQLDTATTLQGQQLVFTEPGSLIELFRNYAALLRLGARQLTGLVGNVAFTRQTGAGTAYWTGEAPTADVTASHLTVDLLSMTPKTLMSQTALSKQLARQAGSADVSVEMLVRQDIARIHALEIDRVGISGTGSNNQPTGLLTASGVTVRTLGANGAVPTYDHIIDMLTDLATANAPDASGVLTTPGIAGKLMKTQKFASTNGQAVWSGGFQTGRVEPGYLAVATNQVPSTLTKGTATTICHAIITGEFSELIFGEWGGFEIEVDPYTLMGRNLYRLVSYQTCDLGVRHGASFVRTVDARLS